ncbi:MAG: ABC transporter substrate-binding protein [Verrucomicrobia bacterium]|nr:ABC transporter substrate-binding protein [Verrucomicrobiota bacterium]MBI3869730.1 ABC transporter substrate-binding protein [Verrucomicrobiota bacterium]
MSVHRASVLRRILTLGVFAVSAHSVVFGADAPLPDPPFISPCEPGVRGGRLVISSFVDPKTFNPITANEQSSLDVLRFFFSGLVDYDLANQTTRPALAESWSVAPDQRTWTFKLRRNQRWSDGHLLTADDVVFTWRAVYDRKVGSVSADAFRIGGKEFAVTKVEDLTVQVVTPSAYAPFLVYFGSIPILPRHILEKTLDAGTFASAYGVNTAPTDLVGSGPFRLKDYRPSQVILLERNPHFWAVDKKGQRLPYLDHIVYNLVPDMNAMSLRFLSGESDVMEEVRPDEYARYRGEAEKGKIQLFDLGPGLDRSFVVFNQNTGTNSRTGKPYVDPVKQKWFRSTQFRQAISHAVDRGSISKSIMAGRATPAYGFESPSNLKWVNLKLPEYPFDFKRSRALLKEIGIDDRDGDGKLEDADGRKIEFRLATIAGNPVRENTAVLLVSDLNKLGLTVTKQTVDFNKLSDTLRVSRDFDAALLRLGGGDTDPTSSMNVLRSDGFTHYWAVGQPQPSYPWEARINELMDQVTQTLDVPTRKKYYDEVQEILAREQPFIHTVSILAAAAAKVDLGNVRPSVIPTAKVTWNAEELYWKKHP